MVRVPPVVSSIRRTQVATPLTTLALAGVAMTSPALAQSRLSMDLDRPVIASGETVGVEVFGHFPSDAFALAQAEFDLKAPAPKWTSASSGALAGDSVLGATFEQIHQPWGGMLADPANPISIWQGAYRPDVVGGGPAFLRLDAKASYYAWYPSDLTSSTAVGEADPARTYLWVDPVHIPGVGEVAPGVGTTMEPLPGGGLIAEPETEEILIGLLLPAVQKVREAAARVESEALAHSGGIQVMLMDGSVRGISHNVSVQHEQVDPGSPESMYELTVETPDPEALIIICIIGPSGEEICQMIPGGGLVARFRNGSRGIEYEWKVEEGEAMASIQTDEPLVIEIPGVFKGEVAGPIEVKVKSGWIGADTIISGLSLELGGLPAGDRTLIEFDTGSCIADFDGDGKLSFFDFLAFQDAFAAGLRSADIDGDGAFTFFDFLAFQDAYAAGC